MLRAGVQAVHELPPCKDVPGGIQNWDCYDAPSTPLPPCDFKHQNPGLDCSADPRPTAADMANESHIRATIDPAYASDHKQSITGRHPQGWPQPLPPCKDVPGGIQNWDCYDAPSTPLPPCDFKHQNPGIDCSADPHPAADMAKDNHVGATIDPTQSIGGHPRHWPQPLPPCKDVPGGIPNQDCSDAPSTPLPPCDLHHQNLGVDCRINPPALKATTQLPDVESP